MRLAIHSTYCLMRVRNTPRTSINISPYEMLYYWPFLSGDMITDPEIANLVKYFTNLDQFQKALLEYGNHILPTPHSNIHSKIQPLDLVLIETWKEDLLLTSYNPSGKAHFLYSWPPSRQSK